jgi:hypothetical protein
MKLSTGTFSIPDLVQMLEGGEISIPVLQRDYVWSEEQVRDLAESIYRNYPIGVIILFRIPKDYKTNEKEEYWIIDGQQRLISLFLIMKGQITLKPGKQKTLFIWFDSNNESFELRAPRGDVDKYWIKLPDLFSIRNKEQVYEWLYKNEIPQNLHPKILILWDQFKKGDYKIPVYVLPDELDIDDIANIFVRVNFAGTKVKGTDIYSTMIAVIKSDLIEELKDFSEQLPIEIDYGILVRTFLAFLTDGVVKLESKVLNQAERLKEILNKKKDELLYIKEDVKRYTEQVLELLRENGFEKIPTENIIPIMSYYLYKRGRLIDSDEKVGLIKWFILATFFQRYSTSTETRMNEDLKIVREKGNYKDLIKKIEEKEGNIIDRIKRYLEEGKDGETRYKLLLFALLKFSKAKDLLTKESIKYPYATIQHIFPKKHLINLNKDKIINDIGNLTLLNYNSNSILSAKLPEEYLSKCEVELLKAHYIPLEKNLWRLDNVEEFVKKRKEMIMKAVEDNFTI